MLQYGTEIISVKAKGGEDKSAPSFILISSSFFILILCFFQSNIWEHYYNTKTKKHSNYGTASKDLRQSRSISCIYRTTFPISHIKLDFGNHADIFLVDSIDKCANIGMFVPNFFTALVKAAGYGLRGTTLDALIVQDWRCVAVASCAGDHGTPLLFRFCLQNIVLVSGTVIMLHYQSESC